ncbi:MAG: TetR family transcriptional regulator C-terminal domain-containing protein [Isosphaeraceae bacterium]
MKSEAKATSSAAAGWDRFEALGFILTHRPQDDPMDCLQYTFLAQMSHRDDFRERLAGQYAAMRQDIGEDLADRARAGGHDARQQHLIAAIVLGAIHGLITQHNVDPSAYDTQDAARLQGHAGSLSRPRRRREKLLKQPPKRTRKAQGREE